MRVLITTPYAPPEVGAAQLRLAAFARELRGAGHDVRVVTAMPNYPSGRLDPMDRWRLSRRETIEGIEVHRLWLYAATGAGVRRLLSYLSFSATGLVGSLSGARPDVVFVESPPLFLGLAGWLAARRFGAAFVLNVSDLWPDAVRDMGVLDDGFVYRSAVRLERWLYDKAAAVTAVTEGIRSRLIADKGLPAERVLFLPNGIDVPAFEVHPMQSGAGAATLVYAGNHGLAQGLDVLLGAAAAAPELEFVLIGDGSDKSRLQEVAARRQLRNLRFLPPMPPAAVNTWYDRAVAGIASLRSTDLMKGARPAKLLAIMASGRPVLYSGDGEGADLVRKAEAGIVVAPEDSAALAAAARAIAAGPERAAVMGSNGRRYVKTHLAWPNLVRDWLEQLDYALRRRSQG
jgi:colanic acid biosynthesis glycosyl transferase WcaI